jgi:SNF2 family DNA or RNA helicase
LRLSGETVLLEEDGEEREMIAAVARLVFIYDGREVAPDDLDLGDCASRDRGAEAQAARMLETLGAVELTSVEGLLPDYDSRANYLITFESEIHVGCSFAAHAVPELRGQGFEVAIDQSFPFDTVGGQSSWYGAVEADPKLDWFTVELGVEINGCSYNLVPPLLELLEQVAEGASLDSLANCPARFRAVPLGDGRYVVVPWERLERILRVLAELYPDQDRPRREIELPISRVEELQTLSSAFEEKGGQLDWISGEEWVERGRILAEGPRFSPQPAALRAELRPYQHEGLMWLEHKRDAGVGGVLADDMGLGKTLQTISLLAREKEARRMDRPSLVIAPKSLLGNWQKELRRFTPHLRVFCHDGPRRHQKADEFDRADVVLCSYPIACRDLVSLSEREYHYLILDEAQAIKNSRSQASTTARSLCARHRLALTGTPVENNLGELWALMEFTVPGLLGTREEFRREFRDPVEKSACDKTLAKLQKRVAPFILRRMKESVARDLPPKTELVRSVELSGDQRDLYESIRLAADQDVRQAISQKGMAGSAVTILDALMKLRQVCCDPRIVSVEEASRVRNSAKFALFFSLLADQLAEGRRVLVFSQFTRMLGLLSRGLAERGIGHFCLTGATPNRQELVDRFESQEVDVFLISLKAGGTGLNLVSADTVIHYDPWWNAAAQMQATDRAYRIGQKKPVFVYNLIAASSVEETMLTLQRRKRHLADTILGDAGDTSSLSEADLDDLFAPLGDAPADGEVEDDNVLDFG